MDITATIEVQRLWVALLPVVPSDPTIPKLAVAQDPSALASLTASDLNNGDVVYLKNGTRGYNLSFGDNGESGNYSNWSVPNQPSSFYTGKVFSGWSFVVTTASTNPSTGNAWYDDSIIAITPTATPAQIASSVAMSMTDFRYAEDTNFSASGNVINFVGQGSVSAGTSTFMLLSSGLTYNYTGTERLIINGISLQWDTLTHPEDGDDYPSTGAEMANSLRYQINNANIATVSAGYDAETGTLRVSGDRALTVTKIDPNQNITIGQIPHPDFIPERYFLVTDSTALPGIAAFQTLA